MLSRRILHAVKSDPLEAATVIYVFLPVLIFLVGYLRMPWSLLSLGMVTAGVILFLLSEAEHSCLSLQIAAPKQFPVARLGRHIVIAVICFFLVALSGMGWGEHDDDYLKHMGLLRDLIDNPWPVGHYDIGADHANRPVVAYLGFYLPQAAFGKVFGWMAARYFQAFWVMLGLYLTLLWFCRVTGRLSLRYVCFFLLFGALDVFGWLATLDRFIDGTNEIELWMGNYMREDPLAAPLNRIFWIIPNPIVILYWGPHHILPGWLIIFYTFEVLLRRRGCHNLLFMASALPLGSAFVSLGLLPFVAAAAIYNRMRGILTVQNLLIGPLIVLLCALYLKTNVGSFDQGWLWDFQYIRWTWQFLVLFYFVAFGFYLTVMPRLRPSPLRGGLYVLLGVAIACFVAFPLYRIGHYNDFPNKGWVAATCALPVVLLMSLTMGRQRDYALKRMLILLLILGFGGGITKLINQWHVTRGEYYFRHADSVPSIDAIARASDPKVATQLYGDPNAFFWRYLARPINYAPSREMPPPPPGEKSDL